MVEVFKKAVERGELNLFEIIVAFSALEPLRVEYIYYVGEQQPTVKFYSQLKKPIPLSNIPDILIQGVSVIMGKDGRILEAIAHRHHE